ncbi:LAMI_0D02894g1_1 [Lachancea mirantina]|uniref:LAMI_0D02894g1_1 n=1 Tax=Lachancea mirantina TaxID=1230905 RepID=A0A1G4JA04_9SACH|nr:LAMI_0D02894g1_1 [Lachancea mirantina]
MSPKLRIAVQGCAHGELGQIYESLNRFSRGQLPDLLIILGDFQSLRSDEDLNSISVPKKYAKLGDFPAYFRGEKEVPLPTIFIGGNHECMQYLMELPFGGYVAKNIYYMGFSGAIVVQGIRISGLSGIFKRHDFYRSRPSMSQIEADGWQTHVKSLYHVRESDMIPLFMQSRIDVMLSHDWPVGAARAGNLKLLLSKKPFFRQDVENGKLGNPFSWQLLKLQFPAWWLSAHLHVYYKATISDNKRSRDDNHANPDEISLDLDDEPEDSVPSEKCEPPRRTNFLALDKCGKGRRHMEIIEVEMDLKHPTYNSDRIDIYIDPEFVSSVRYLQSNPPNRGLGDLDVVKLLQNRPPMSNVDWSVFATKPMNGQSAEEQTRQLGSLYKVNKDVNV